MDKIKQTKGQELFGTFAPDFAHLNDDILFGETWNNGDIDHKTRCIVTVVSLVAGGLGGDALRHYLQVAKEGGVTQREIAAILTHTAFYSGWPKAWAALQLAKEIWPTEEKGEDSLAALLKEALGEAAEEPIPGKKLLIVYYSYSGNTKGIAQQLQKETGATMVKIAPVVPYGPEEIAYFTEGGEEVMAKVRPPKLRPLEADIGEYDVIALGTPVWWYGATPPATALLQNMDLKEKTLIPFVTDGGESGHALADLRKAAGEATIACEKAIHFDENGGKTLVTPQAEVESWIARVKDLLQ